MTRTLAPLCLAVMFLGIISCGPPKSVADISFTEVPAGEFQMGAGPQEGAAADEQPIHRVVFTQGFEIGTYEVSQKQWEQIMGSNPSYFPGIDRPVENISWKNIQKFISELNKRDKNYTYRLPTEAEWEYAARAGSTTTYFFGTNPDQLDEYAWWAGNSGGETHPVGQKAPNSWGLYDMTGNVWELCQDWYLPDYYAQSPVENPPGPLSGEKFPSKVRRGGGSWNEDPAAYRTACRSRDRASRKSTQNGFRLIRIKKE